MVFLYFSQGILYESGSIISQSLLLAILLINVVFFIKVILQKNKNSFIWLWTILYLLIVLGYLFCGDYGKPLFVSQLKAISIFMLSFYPFFYWSKIGVFNEKIIKKMIWFLLPLFIFAFFLSETALQTEKGRETVVNNSAYYFVSLMPFLYFLKNKNWSFILLIACILFLIMGAKRGALLAGSASSLLFIFFYLKQIKTKKTIKKIRILLGFVCLIIISIYFINDFLTQNDFILKRIEDNRSTRPQNYLALWNHWLNSQNHTNFLFGYGYFTTPTITPERVMAHNDWLEMLTDFGLVGVLIYLFTFLAFIFQIKKHDEILLKFVHTTIALCYLLISTFSMWVNNGSNIFYAIIMGYLIANINSSFKTQINDNNEEIN